MPVVLSWSDGLTEFERIDTDYNFTFFYIAIRSLGHIGCYCTKDTQTCTHPHTEHEQRVHTQTGPLREMEDSSDVVAHSAEDAEMQDSAPACRAEKLCAVSE